MDVLTGDKLLTVSEVAAMLRVPTSWVYERTRARGAQRIPHVKLGKYLRFDGEQIKTWVSRMQEN